MLQKGYIDDNLKNIGFLSFLPLLLFPILQFSIVSKLIIIWSLINVISGYKNLKNNATKLNVLNFIKLNSWVLVILAILFTSNNVIEDLKIVKGLIPFFVLPFVYFFFYKEPFNKSQLNVIYLVFILANLLYVLFVLYYLHNRFYEMYIYNYNQFDFLEYIKYLYNYRGYLYDEREGLKFWLFYNKLYNSSFIAISILLMLKMYGLEKEKLYKIPLIVIMVLFLAILLIMSSYPIILITLFLLAVYVFNQIFKTKIITGFVIGLFSLLIFGFCLSSIIINDSKIVEQLKSGIEYRANIFNCASGIIKEDILFGHSITNQQDKLNKCYESLSVEGDKNYYLSYELNSHNYYLFLMMTGGVVVLSLFLVMFYNCLKNSLIDKNPTYFYFLILIVGILFIENYFYRMYGVMVFCVFNTLWYSKLWK